MEKRTLVISRLHLSTGMENIQRRLEEIAIGESIIDGNRKYTKIYEDGCDLEFLAGAVTISMDAWGEIVGALGTEWEAAADSLKDLNDNDEINRAKERMKEIQAIVADIQKQVNYKWCDLDDPIYDELV